jgi:hypothetical protein
VDVSDDGDMEVIVRTAAGVVTAERTRVESWEAPVVVVGSAVDCVPAMRWTAFVAADGQLDRHGALKKGILAAGAAGFPGTKALHTADLNGDMASDLLVWAETADGLGIRWVESRPGAAPITHVVLGPGDTNAKPTGASPITAQVDGDGQLDFVAAFEPGRVRAYLAG